MHRCSLWPSRWRDHPYEYHPSTSTRTSRLPVLLKTEMVPLALTVATTRLALVSPAAGLRSEELGSVDPGKTVRNVAALGAMPVRLTTTAVASAGTPSLTTPPLVTVSVSSWEVPEARCSFEHWFEGLKELGARV